MPTTSTRLRLLAAATALLWPWHGAQGETDPAAIEAACAASVSAAGHDPEADPFERDPVPLALLDAIGSSCGDTIFWMAVPHRLAQGDVRGALRDWTLALARASLLRTVHPTPSTPSGYALFGALASTLGPHVTEIIERDPSLARAATEDAIAWDLANPSIALPPSEHPEAYAEMRAALERRLVSLDALVLERRADR